MWPSNDSLPSHVFHTVQHAAALKKDRISWFTPCLALSTLSLLTTVTHAMFRGWTGGHFPLLLKWRGRLWFVPLLFRGIHFCTNASGIHWIIRAIFVKFISQFSWKLLKLLPLESDQMSHFKAKMHQNPILAGTPLQTLLGEFTALLQTPGWFKRPTSKGRKRERREWREGRVPSYLFLRIYTHDSCYRCSTLRLYCQCDTLTNTSERCLTTVTHAVQFLFCLLTCLYNWLQCADVAGYQWPTQNRFTGKAGIIKKNYR